MSNETVEFTIHVKMPRKWVGTFLGMLTDMQRFGKMGVSRFFLFHLDGAQGFQPTFRWDTKIRPKSYSLTDKGEYYFDLDESL